MSTAVTADLLGEITETKSPDVKLLLKLRDQLLADPNVRRQAEDALDNWTATRERQGILLYLIGRIERALAILETEASADWGKHFLARAFVDSGFYARGEEMLTDEFKKDKSVEVGLPLFRAQLMQGKFDDAEKTTKQIKDDHPAVQAAAIELKFRNGDLQGALEDIVPLFETDGDERHVAFVYAQIAQAAGDDNAARRAYERIAQIPPVAVDVLINLGTLYEDEGEWELAVKCYDTILSAFPTHRRARLFRRDAESSQNMYYDEDRERKEDKRLQILRTPVTDFELSVRSRNCLNKMNIRNLGDLVTKTEEELLSYKNFGETSLNEIKRVLGQKGLRLGMKREDGSFIIPDDFDAARSVDLEQELTWLGELTDEQREALELQISTLNLSVRCHRALVERLGLQRVGDILLYSEEDLLGMPNFGITSLNELLGKLGEFGLRLRSGRGEDSED